MLMKKAVYLLMLVSVPSLISCQSGGDDESTSTLGIWGKSSSVSGYSMSNSDGNMNMSITEAGAGESLLIYQEGLTGDFTIQTAFSDFDSGQDGSFFYMVVYSAASEDTLSCGIELLPGTTYPTKLSVTGKGLTNLANAPGLGGTLTISRSSTTVTISCKSNGYGPADMVFSGYTSGDLNVGMIMGNSNSSTGHTGTVSVKVNDFGVIGGGDSVIADDFSQYSVSAMASMFSLFNTR